MRSPEAARALPELVSAGVLTPEQAAPLLAAARAEIVSVRGELRALLGLGVAALTAGIGLFLKEHHEELGPLPVAALLALAAAGCLALLVRRAAPFSWTKPAAGADWIVDGLLVLAVSLIGADLAWIEWQLSPLGANWPWHLLLMSVVTAVLAVRFDSVPGWTLALSTFAAWRGVSLMPVVGASAVFGSAGFLRVNLLFCAAVFAALGFGAVRTNRKAHFEPATTFLAALAACIALASGIGEGDWPLWATALAGFGLGVARFAFVRRRLGLFAMAALAVYVAATRFLVELPGAGYLGCFWFVGSTIGAIAMLIVVHRKFHAAEALAGGAARAAAPVDLATAGERQAEASEHPAPTSATDGRATTATAGEPNATSDRAGGEEPR